MFKDSTINLSHEDLEQAIAYWLNGKILGYDIREKQKVELSVANGEYLVHLTPIPPKPSVPTETM